MRFVSPSVIKVEVMYSISAVSTGFAIPKPPKRVGRAIRRRSVSDISLPMRDGIKECLIASSNG